MATVFAIGFVPSAQLCDSFRRTRIFGILASVLSVSDHIEFFVSFTAGSKRN